MTETMARLSIIAAITGVLFVCAGCAKPLANEGPAPASLAKADPVIVAVAPTLKGVLVTARLNEPDVAGDSIRTAARVVRQLDRAVQAGAPDLPAHASVVTFQLYGVEVDKFGHRRAGSIFSSDFDINDLRNADLKVMGPAKVLNLAIDLRIDHAGISAINAWCMRYPHVGWNYCEMAGN
jgi:hypothetical protein